MHHHRFSLRQMGPAMAGVSSGEKWRAALGTFLGVLLVGIYATRIEHSGAIGLILIAPFGASAVLLFGVPNSPLSQPWSAVVGNGVSAMTGVAATLWIPDPALAAAVATGGAILLMHLARALHPPGGAIALTTTLLPDLVQEAGFFFVLSPVLLGTCILVVLASVWAPLTGRHYPFRQKVEPHSPVEGEEPRRDPLGLSRSELADLLADFRHTTNIGVEDLARIIAGAEDRAASMRLGYLTCGDIMSRDLVSVRGDAPLSEVVDLFAAHGFTSLPVVAEDGRFLGLIFQLHLIRRANEEARGRKGRFLDGMMAAIDPKRRGVVYARDIMRVGDPHFAVGDPVLDLLPTLSEGLREAVAVLDGDRAVGIVTRTDLVAMLSHALVRPLS